VFENVITVLYTREGIRLDLPW